MCTIHTIPHLTTVQSETVVQSIKKTPAHEGRISNEFWLSHACLP